MRHGSTARAALGVVVWLSASAVPARAAEAIAPLDVEVAVAQDSVALTFTSSEAQRTTTYRFDSSGGMEIAVQVSSGQIEKPMEWKIRYRRSASEPRR